MFSFKSNAWQLGLTACLLVLTFLTELTGVFSGLEYELFEYIIALQPDRVISETYAIRSVPGWVMLLLYTMIFTVYVRTYTRSRTTAGSFLTLSIILFLLLMVEIVFAVWYRIFIPVILPVVLMLLVSSIYWVNDIYQRITALKLLVESSVSLDDVQHKIEAGELKSALILLKQCPLSDDLLELGYELGMLLESGNHWASALNLYHWLSSYDPGLSDFVTRVEEIKANRKPGVEESSRDQGLKNISHYQVLKKIARGATATVYEGYDFATHNRVALKVMSSKLDDSEEGERIKHWLYEAEIVSQLDHPNIVKIHDAAVFNGTPYIAMDYIPGYPMSQRLRRREYITVGECIRISKSVLYALTEAHHSGVIHGDIKPANIMYDNHEKTYIITDFGAAYSREIRGHSVIVGTPGYMSPEQLEGKKLDGRSDLFSLAVTLYHLLTGYQPFTGKTLPQIKRSITSDEPNLDHLSLPIGIKEVILKALQKKTYMRFADAQQMLTAVEYCEKQMLKKVH